MTTPRRPDTAGTDPAEMPTLNARPILSFHHPSGEAVTWGELGPDYLGAHALGPSSWERPVRIELEPQLSKRGNTFYSYEQSLIPLPDGLQTELRLDEQSLHAGEIGESKRGNETRRHQGTLTINDALYEAVGYVTKSRIPYWVKVHLQRAVSNRPPATEPRGGRFV